MSTAMSDVEVMESKSKLFGLSVCPKCKDKKKFLSKEQLVEICKEC